MTQVTSNGHAPGFPMDAILNLAKYHREHEKFYSVAPLRDAATVAQISLTLKALADRWGRVAAEPAGETAGPYIACEDLNDQTAIETLGILFMEGIGEPPELVGLRVDLRRRAAAAAQTGFWLRTAMSSSWDSAKVLLGVRPLADLLGERHRIIANNLQAADMSCLVGLLLSRAADILDEIDFTPARLRADLAADRTTPGYIYAATMLLDRAVDLMATSTTLTRDSEPAWRAWSHRAEQIQHRELDLT